MTFCLYSCHRLSASISREQCGKNRAAHMGACTGCPGLPPEPAGVVEVHLPLEEERAITEVPTVTLSFADPEDRELFATLQKVCSDLEYDIISLLHLSCRGSLEKMKGITRTGA